MKTLNLGTFLAKWCQRRRKKTIEKDWCLNVNISDLKHVRRQRDGDGKLNNVELNKLRKKIGPQYPLYETNTV